VLPAIDRLHEDRYLPEKERQWTLIDLKGRVALYAWSDPAEGWNEAKTDRAREASVRALEIQPDQRAFGTEAETAPNQRRGEGPQGRDNLWAQFTASSGPRAPDSHEALFHWYVSNLETQQAVRAAATDYAGLIARAIGLGAVPRIMPEKLYFAVVPVRAVQMGPQIRFRSPASALLAIRAARRALAQNADDDAAYKFLALSYQLLPENQAELFNPQSRIGELRRCQIAGALYNANKLRSDRPEIHEQMWKFYGAQNFLDLSAQHLREYLRLTEEAGARQGERLEDYGDRLRELRDLSKQTDERLKQVQNQYLINSKPFSNVLAKVELAQKRGLAGEALDLLIKAKPEELGAMGQALELLLLLRVGRVEEWPEDLRDPGNDDTLASLLVARAATVGDYDQADELLAKMIPVARERYLAALPPSIAAQVAPLWMDMFDATGQRPLGWGIAQRLFNMQRLQIVQRFSPLPPEVGEYSVLRGILALEAGNNQHALEQFRYALTVSFPPSRYVPYFAILGTNLPLEAAGTLVAGVQLATGPVVNVPSLRWALDYAHLLEQTAKTK